MGIYVSRLREATRDELINVANRVEPVSDTVYRYAELRDEIVRVRRRWEAVGSNRLLKDAVGAFLEQLDDVVSKLDGVMVGWLPRLGEAELDEIGDDLGVVIDGLEEVVEATREADIAVYDTLAACMKGLTLASQKLDDLIKRVGRGHKAREAEPGERKEESMVRHWSTYWWRRGGMLLEATADLPPQLKALLPSFRRLREIQDEMDKLEKRLKELEAEWKELSGIIGPILEEMKLARVEFEDLVVTFKSWDRPNVSYAKAVDELLYELSERQRKIWAELKDKYTSISRIRKYEFEGLHEQGVLKRIWDWAKGWVSKVVSWFRGSRQLMKRIKDLVKRDVRGGVR